jgi:serine/threonine protein kinase
MSLIDLSQGQVKVVATFYDVLEPLGEGRFAEVYRAYDKSSSTDVALKIYRQFDERTHDLARAEAKVLASLGRQNSEFFPRYRRLLKHLIKNNNHPVLAMEYGFYSSPDGTRRCMSLEKVLPRVGSPAPVPPIPEFWEWAALRNWAIELAAAVKVLHDSSVIHRDIKPANILLKRQPSAERSGPMLLDFNTAARQDAPSSKGGTPRYLPPEVRDGRRREAGEADDLWGLAYTLWELFFGLETKVDAGSFSDQRRPSRRATRTAIPLLERPPRGPAADGC